MRTLRTPVVAAALAALALPLDATGQDSWQVGAAAAFERYSFSEEEGSDLESISLVSLPFQARARLGRNVFLDARGAWADGRVNWRDGRQMQLSGPTDTEVRLGWDLAARAVRLELIGYLPTGATTHDEEEAVVAGIVAADLLPFRISNWGSAGAVALSVSGARRFGDLGLGASVGYRMSGDFDPVQEQQFVYEPGNELRVRVGLDYRLTRSQKLSLAVGYRNYDADVANDANLFQTGDRLIGIATWSFPAARRSAGALYGGLLHRERGTFIDVAAPEVPSQDLILAGGMVRAPLWGGFVVPRADVRLFRQSAGVGDGHVIGVGVSLENAVGGGMTLLPSATLRFGSVETAAGTDTGFNGFDLGLIARLGPQGR